MQGLHGCEHGVSVDFAIPGLVASVGLSRVSDSEPTPAAEIIVETAYQPDPALWEPDFKTRRTSR